jgi:hypothetical protein
MYIFTYYELVLKTWIALLHYCTIALLHYWKPNPMTPYDRFHPPILSNIILLVYVYSLSKKPIALHLCCHWQKQMVFIPS